MMRRSGYVGALGEQSPGAPRPIATPAAATSRDGTVYTLAFTGLSLIMLSTSV